MTEVRNIEAALRDIFAKHSKVVGYHMANDLAASLEDLYEDFYDQDETPELAEARTSIGKLAKDMRAEGNKSKWKL